MAWRRELTDAVAEVEDMCLPHAFSLMRRTKISQHRTHFSRYRLRRREEHIRIDVALHGLARALQNAARSPKATRPIQPNHLARQIAHAVQPQAAAFGEHDARHDVACGVRSLELRKDAPCVGQAELVTVVTAVSQLVGFKFSQIVYAMV